MKPTNDLTITVNARKIDLGQSPFARYLLSWTWAQPFVAVMTFDLLLWQLVALFGMDTTITVAGGSALLVALLATLWRDGKFVYVTFVSAWLALIALLRQSGVAFADQFAVTSGAGLGFYLLAWASDRIQFARVALWRTPLRNAAIAYTGVAMFVSLVALAQFNSLASAIIFAFAGLLYLGLAFQRRGLRVGYLGVALLEIAWMFLMTNAQIREPQWYAIPAGIYLIGVGFLERRRAKELNQPRAKQLALMVEGLGMAVLLLTTFAQSLNGAAGFAYFLLMMGEGLAVIAWGAFRHLRIPFLVGIGAIVLNVLAQIFVLIGVYDINRWLVIFGVGFVLVSLAVFVERKRAQIIAQAQAWLAVLETWE